jgi:hypothetical protein
MYNRRIRGDYGMIVDLNEPAGQVARVLLTVDAVYHTIRHPNEPFYEHTGDRLTPKAGFLLRSEVIRPLPLTEHLTR